MMKRLVLAFSVLAFVLTSSCPAAASDRSDRVVVLLSLDGLAGFYLDDAKAEMPTIRQLMAEGARAASMKVSTPSVTWPNHTTLVTGVHPARHGIVGNVFYDRAVGKHVALIGDAVFEKDQILRVPTLYDAAKKAGLTTASVRWPVTRGARTIDWLVPDGMIIDLLNKSTTPSLLSELRQAGLWAEMDEAQRTQKDGRHLPTDRMHTAVFNHILRKHRPNFAMLHLFEADHDQHTYGPATAEAYAAVKKVDGHVREILDVLKAEFPGRATLVITSDHGFSPIDRLVLPNVVLRKAKLLNAVEGDDTKPLVRVVSQGGCAMIYILDASKRDETAKRVKEAFAGMEGVAKVIGPDETPSYGVARPADDPHAPDMLLFAEYGNAFGDTAAGDLPFTEKPERKGTHGHDPGIPELHACFVAWGAGVKPGAKLGEIENTEVTPTIAKLMGFDMPGLDGKPLDAILLGK